MTKLKKYNLSGEEVGQVSVSEALATAEVNTQMIKDYIVALRNNARRWTASTKTRSEVVHTTKKPHAQKHTGNARQGSLVGPQFRGGGRVGTPRPKFDQHVRINKKERQAVIRALLAEKIREQRIVVLQDMQIAAPKTKAVVGFLDALALSKRVLFVGESPAIGSPAVGTSVDEKRTAFELSLRNLPMVEYRVVSNMSGYDLILSQNIVVSEAALEQMAQWLGEKAGV